MAKRQYRVSSPGEWTSNYGYSFIALLNSSGSGRKLTLRQLNAFVLSQRGAAVSVFNAQLYQSATPFVGENMRSHGIAVDSTASFPSTVVVRRDTQVPSFSATGWPVSALRHSGAVGTQNTVYCQKQIGNDRLAGVYRQGSKRGTSAVEAITIPQNTGVALVTTSALTETHPVRVNVVASIDSKTFVWDFVASPVPGLALFSLENTGTNVVKLLRYSLAELGTADTPFIRLVPIGQNYASDLLDTSKQVFSVEPMDSTYPALTALKVFGDIGFIPSGSPEVVINEGSAGTPKGVNYLHTRDFNGPAFRVFLPEMKAGSGVSSTSDMWGHQNSFNMNDMLTRVNGTVREGITLNPGEGVALVASSETFIGVQGAFSGWPQISFQAIIDSEPQINPTLTLTGLKNPTEVRVFTAGTTTQLTGQENVTSGTFTWNYDPDLVSSVDISILALGYQNTRLLAVATTSNVSIPVQQVVDRQYLNP